MQSRNRPAQNNIKNFGLDESRNRFQIELEFVQCLANPNYLNCLLTFSYLSLVLAQQGWFEKPNFIKYLKYLQYWKDPAYSRYLIYPYCLHLLDLLQHAEFRSALARGQICRMIDDQILLHWQHYMRKRAALIAKHVEETIQPT
ncbi:Mediator of RNA polymerase II transcription subunit 31 isoform 2 [Schistosoma japonicum]|uniref:Mediator of RNA polymerase II transcription subunit 31 n=1 Tax=Schistosoma japonicum TaxID=6182 RepID=A0A4Z2DD28_SCHJA|nr:Mediator of RNA polymerase II transcription subunit 31 isoform 2 [Schistosoma japonicum]